MTADISSLPLEVLIRIFQFLDVRSRLKASLVCKTWFQIMDHPQMLCDVKVQFSGEVDEAIKRFSRMTRKFQWFSFVRVIIRAPVVDFLKNYSKQFVILSFHECTEIYGKSESEVQDKILHCDNLRILDVSNSDIAFSFSPLLNLTELKLCFFSGLSDYIVSQFSKSLSKLEKLSLGDSVVYEEEVCKNIYATEEEIETNPSQTYLSFLCIKMLIEKNRATLRNINFTNLRLTSEDILTISKIEDLKLTHILFPEKLNSIHVERFCENQTSLVAVDFTTSVHVEDNTVYAVIKCLQNLQELVLFNKRKIDKCIIEILQLENLVKLDLYCCSNISQLSYQEALLNLKTFKLKSLNLASANISDDNLFKLLKCNKNIRYLNVSDTCISNKTLNMICNNLILLECLILSSCREISDSGLTGEFENYSDSLTPTPLSNLKYLTQLNLSKSSLITNEGCIKAIRFPKLEKLLLNKCRRLILCREFKKELKTQNPYLHNFNPSY
ncbi:f-box domain-containing protein [Trichonephila inaurata madagascariensis]|uniref:F-box domain-containing protein n=1 Tax=Trichonephila inaurata madagascariensis TaxID=2747483 RepID=A0A8X6XTT5_9ARAC|nr:f-box domain-containing protein [Trichonephila inaurata madagascariensis]